MTLFWIITAAMIVVALALLAPTLLRRHAASSDSTERFNVEIARERLADLVAEKNAGGLSDEEFNQGRRDLELALAQDLEGTAEIKTPTAGSGGRWALLAAAMIATTDVPVRKRLEEWRAQQTSTVLATPDPSKS